MTRIRTRILLGTLLVVATTLALGGLLARRVTHQQVERLLVDARRPPPVDLRPLADYRRAHGSWSGVEPLLDRLAAASQGAVALTSSGGTVLATSRTLRDARVTVDGAGVVIRRGSGVSSVTMRLLLAPAALRDASGATVGLVYLLPSPSPSPSREEPLRERAELAALDRRLLLVLAGATLVAVAVSVLVARRITQPIEQLGRAVDALAAGGTPSPIAVAGDDEIARLARSFDAMTRSLAAQEELRRRMVADVAHELRTPLTRLRGELEAIQDGLAAADPAHLASLHDEVLELARLVDDLQELALAEARALALEREPADLLACARRVAAAFGAEARRRGIELDVTGEALVARVDERRIGQVLRNLVGNAMRHTPDGGCVAVRVERRSGEACIAVANRGPAIPEGELERIFERFYRTDASRDRASGGAGLGLAIARRLVDLHGGRVWAENGVGGPVFRVALPLAG